MKSFMEEYGDIVILYFLMLTGSFLKTTPKIENMSVPVVSMDTGILLVL